MSLVDINKIRFLNTLTNTSYLIFSKFFTTDEKNLILDPLTCIIRLAILFFKPNGTKISIYQNRISYHDPNIFQGTIRWGNGDNRNDLHNLHNPILKAVNWYDSNDEIIKKLFTYACKGLEKLKNSYNKNSIICHSIDRYIDLLSNKDKKNIEFEENNINLCKDLKKLWNNTQINIIYNLLNEATNNEINENRKESFINAIDNILLVKEDEVLELIKKNTTIL